MRKHKKKLNFEINVVPFISLLSVCICFLLLTAVWLHIGALNVKQAVGGQPAAEAEKKPTMWVRMGKDGEVSLDLKDARVSSKLARMTIKGLDGKPNLVDLAEVVNQIKVSEPALTTALIQPQPASVYEDIILIMDLFKKSGLIDLGVTPL